MQLITTRRILLAFGFLIGSWLMIDYSHADPISPASAKPSAPVATPDAPTGNFAAFKPNDVILFQGDSITDGGRQRTGSDYNHIMGQCYAYIIAAELGAKMPERNLNFMNKGISGNRVFDLAARWQADTLNVKPNFLSILIGINDTLSPNNPESTEQFQQTYDKLLADTFKALPSIKVVLCEPFLLPVGPRKANYAEKLAEVKKRQAVVAQLAEKYKLPLVHFQQAFDTACTKAPPEHWSWDGVHPTYAGHGLMAEEWKKVVDWAWVK